MRVDPSNVEQLRAWDGDQGAYWTKCAGRFDEGVASYHGQFLAAAAIDTTANVLDIGCGSGQTTRDAARCATAGSALGVDLSSRMIELARELTEREHVANATFQQADAQVHPFPDQYFDVTISRYGAMFFGDASAAFTNIGRAMRRGGRLILMCWQPLQRNEWISAFRAALAVGRELPMPPPRTLGPFSLSDPDQRTSHRLTPSWPVRRPRMGSALAGVLRHALQPAPVALPPRLVARCHVVVAVPQPDGPVDEFPDDVSMPGVPVGLGDHVYQDFV